jgi:hypothetical protein
VSLMDFIGLDVRKYAGLSGLDCACQNMGAPSKTAAGMGDAASDAMIANMLDYQARGQAYAQANPSAWSASVPDSSIASDVGSGIQSFLSSPQAAALTNIGLAKLVPGYTAPRPQPVAPAGPSVGTVLLVLGGLGAAGFAASKLSKK